MRMVASVFIAGMIFVGCGGTPAITPPGSAAAGTAPTPSAQPTAAVTAAPSASAKFPTWYTGSDGAGILSAGSVTTRSFRPGFTFNVPEGWVNDGDSDGFYALFPDTPANQAEFVRSGAFAHSIHMGPLSSPYFYCQALENNRGATAAEMVAAVTVDEALATTGLVDVAIGGLTGKQFDVRMNPDWTGTCPGDPPGLDLQDWRTRGMFLDAPGRGVLVLFVGSSDSADHEAFLAEAMPIIESFQFSQ